MPNSQMKTIKRIVIVGPESTGKSTLCKQLAERFNTLWVPEFAREYLLRHGMSYGYNDLLTIAQGQVKLEEDTLNTMPATTAKKQQLLFIDTNMYVMQVWCEFVFQKCHSWILEQIVERPYDFYLLCDVDLPWVKDELREYPDLESRKKLFHIYKQILISQQVPWEQISGNYDHRFLKAVAAVKKHFRT
jgi:NadR type nicotinamide-nucleotide adenylyltransferase